MADVAKPKDYTGKGLVFGCVFGFAVILLTFHGQSSLAPFGWGILTGACFALAGAFLDYLEGN